MLTVTYAEVGATAGELPTGYRHVHAERVIGHGREEFERAADDLFAGMVQRRAGATIRLSDVPLREGTYVHMRLRLGPLRFSIPCVVVWAERTADSCGFAYGTLPGHPERGEERFQLRLTASDEVTFTIVAFSAPARWFTRLGRPVARQVQTIMTRRYVKALDTTAAKTSRTSGRYAPDGERSMPSIAQQRTLCWCPPRERSPMSDALDPDAEHSTVSPQASVEDELDQADETVAVDPASLDAPPTEDDDGTPDTPPSPDLV